MAKNRYFWLAAAAVIIIIGAFLMVGRSKAPSDSLQVEKSNGEGNVVNIDLEKDADFEQDIDDLNVDEEVLNDIDGSDFDENAIDDNVL